LLLEEILSAVGSDFPRTLSLHRQGLFALGFYHQKAYDRAQANAHKESQSGANQ
jgi:CRISPR-associated protein Csd1